MFFCGSLALFSTVFLILYPNYSSVYSQVSLIDKTAQDCSFTILYLKKKKKGGGSGSSSSKSSSSGSSVSCLLRIKRIHGA